MPQLGESVTEGTVERWMKQEGDDVALDDPIVEVSSDKVSSEIPSQFAGRLIRILVPEGQTVPVDTPIAAVETADEEVSPAETMNSPSQEAAPNTATRPVDALREIAQLGREEAARQRSTPLVRRLANEQGVSLTDIAGTGFGGRVRRDDLAAFLRQQHSGDPPESPSRGSTDAWTLIPLSPMRRAIAASMSRPWACAWSRRR